MPNQRLPPPPSGLPSVRQQLSRRLAGQAALLNAARRAALEIRERFRRAPRKPQEGRTETRTTRNVRSAPAPPQPDPTPVGLTANGEASSLPPTATPSTWTPPWHSNWITADARKEPPTEKPAGEENPAVRPRPTGRKNPQKERRCATLLFRRRRARSRLPQPCPPNPPRNPCFFRPTIPGLRAEQSSPTAIAASQRPRAAIEAIKGPRRACRAHSDSGSISDSNSNSIPSTFRLLAPAPNRLPIHLRLRFRPPTSDPFAPLVSEPGHPLFPARSLPYERTRPPPIPPRIPSHPRSPVTPRPVLSLRRQEEARRQEEVPGPTDVTGTIPGGSRLHQVVPLVHSVNKGFATTVCLFPPLPRALTADPWTPSLRRATPAVWRPTTAEKRDWRSRHTTTDRRQIASRDVTTGSDRHKIHMIDSECNILNDICLNLTC
ncbi:hypothetical protein GEV33_002401 [Tenebrio molitor]|uniref:Uncharacterized protein n=1 Tax=Tenebrio molitor TaxID=7067 RepID=A0A8J6HV26_TENMO|nr:hypothetical protein GEV33_002401 [Tenebrio molitor]